MSDVAKGIIKAAAITAAVYFTGGAAAGALGWAKMGWGTAAMIGGLVTTAISGRGLKSQLDNLNDEIVQKQAGIQHNATGTEVTLPIIYGKAKVGMSVVDTRQGTDVNVLAIVGAIAIAPEGGSTTAEQGIEAVTDVYFNELRSLENPVFGTNSTGNNPQPFDAGVVKSPWNGNVSSGTFGTNFYLQYFLHDGDDSQTVDFYLNDQFGTTPWPAAARGVGVAYIVLWLYFKDDIYTNGVPNVTMKVKGNKVANVQNLSAVFRYSENPADCIYDYMTSTRYGMGIPAAQIDCAQTTLQANPIATTSGSTVITVSHSSALDVLVGDRILLSGATATGGITAARLNVEMTIASMPSTSSFTADLGGANATSTVAAGGGSSVLFDASSFGIAAAYCDESVTITISDGDDVTLANRFTCNGFLMPDDGPLSNLERLLSSCCGRLVMESGKYKLVIRRTQSAETFELNRTNIVGEWTFARTGVDETPNTLVCTYVDSDLNYTPRPITFPEAGATNSYLTADNNYDVESRLELPFTENGYMAEMIASQQFLERRADMGCTLVAQREALKLSCGDVVNVNHDTPSWTDQKMWVEAVGLRRDGLVGLALKEYDASVYTVPSMKEQPAMIAAVLPARYTDADAPTVQLLNFQTEAELDSGDEYFCKMSLTFSGGMGSYKVTHDPDSGSTYNYITDFTGTSTAPYLLQSGSSSAYIFDASVPTGESTITVTPYPDASAGGIAGPAITVVFDISGIE
jgi:hypothetical protein